MTYILLLPGSKVPYSVDICKFESYHHNVYHDRSIHQCLQRINRENRICMRKRQLSAGQNLSSIQSPLTTSSIKHTLPTLLYVLCFYEFPKFKLYSASFPDFYIVLFGFPSPPPRKKNHPYQTRVLLPTKTPLLPTSIQSSSSSKSWEVVSKLEVGPMFFFSDMKRK